MPSRRQFLAAATAGCVGTAGCTGLTDVESSYEPGTDDATEWRFPDRDRSATAYAPDAAATRDGASQCWREEVPGASGRPVVGEGLVVVPAVDGLVAFDLATGDERWSFSPSEGSWASPPTLHDGTVYAGFASRPSLRALDAETGEPDWSLDSRGTVEAAVVPTRDGDELYVGDDTGRVYVLGSDGSVEYTYDAVGAVTAVAGGRTTVVVGTNGGQVYELYDDGSTFYPLWRRRVAGGVQDLAVLGGGSVAVSVFGDYVYRLQNGAHAGSERWRASFTANDFLVTRSHVVGTNLSTLAGLGAQDGDRLWSRSGSYTCAPAGAGDTFFVGGEYEDSDGGYAEAYPLSGGGVLSTAPDRRWRRDLDGSPVGGLTVADGALFAVVRRWDASDRVVAFDPA